MMEFIKYSDGEIGIFWNKKQIKFTDTAHLRRLGKLGQIKSRKEYRKEFLDCTIDREITDNPFTAIHSDFDGLLMKAFFPMHFTADEWKALQSDLWIDFCNPYEDGRDCTDAKFTEWIDRYAVPNGTWVYHRVGIDV